MGKNLEGIINNARGYMDAKQELIKLQAIKKMSGIISGIISFCIIIPFFFLAFLFVSFTLAQLFSEWLGHQYAGYLLVTGIYTVAGLLLYRFRKSWLFRPIRNKIIKQIFAVES